MDTPSFTSRLGEWLREEGGVVEPRRVVSRERRRVLVSKFGSGFAARLGETLASLPELVHAATLTAAYRREASERPAAPVAELWHATVSGQLRHGAQRAGLSGARQAEVQAGLDSVAAVLASTLWGETDADGRYAPTRAETAAFADALAQLAGSVSMFTRDYGVFEGARVVNHCPGASYARGLLALAWTVCTGMELPAASHPLLS